MLFLSKTAELQLELAHETAFKRMLTLSDSLAAHLLLTCCISNAAVALDEAGFCPVIRSPSLTI